MAYCNFLKKWESPKAKTHTFDLIEWNSLKTKIREIINVQIGLFDYFILHKKTSELKNDETSGY